MLYKILVILHLLGAATWTGGHAALVRVILPAALKNCDPKPILAFERGYGKVGLLALVCKPRPALVPEYLAWLLAQNSTSRCPPPTWYSPNSSCSRRHLCRRGSPTTASRRGSTRRRGARTRRSPFGPLLFMHGPQPCSPCSCSSSVRLSAWWAYCEAADPPLSCRLSASASRPTS